MLDSGDVVITTILSLLVIVDIVGNSLVCAIIKKNRVMRYVESEIPVVNNGIYRCLQRSTLHFFSKSHNIPST